MGSNLLDCHPEPSRSLVADLLARPRVNVYTREFWAVEVSDSPAFTPGKRAVLFKTPESIPNAVVPTQPSYAVMPDGSGFVFVAPSRTIPPTTELVVVLNWFEELKAKFRK